MKAQMNHPYKKLSDISNSKIKVRNIKSMLGGHSVESTALNMFVQYVAAELHSLPPLELIQAEGEIFKVITQSKIAILQKPTKSVPVSSSEECQGGDKDSVFDKNRSQCNQTSTVTHDTVAQSPSPRGGNSVPNSAPVSPLSGSGSGSDENEDYNWEKIDQATENNINSLILCHYSNPISFGST